MADQQDGKQPTVTSAQLDLSDSTKTFLEGLLPARKGVPPAAQEAAGKYSELGQRLLRE